jgi:hypothetical protein
MKGGDHSRNISSFITSRCYFLTLPSLTLVNPSGPHTANPTRSSLLKDAVVHARGTSSGDHEPEEEDKLTRIKNWIEVFGAVELRHSFLLLSCIFLEV